MLLVYKLGLQCRFPHQSEVLV